MGARRSRLGGRRRAAWETEIDLDGDGKPDVRFSRECGFLLQLERGQAIAVETDRAVTAEVRGRQLTLKAQAPVVLNDPKRRQ